MVVSSFSKLKSEKRNITVGQGNPEAVFLFSVLIETDVMAEPMVLYGTLDSPPFKNSTACFRAQFQIKAILSNIY